MLNHFITFKEEISSFFKIAAQAFEAGDFFKYFKVFGVLRLNFL